jgi:WD40 repeat protein
MAAPLESSVVRIYSKSGKVVGGGFLVSSKYVLTCAHVVTDALGIPRTTQDQPDGVINLDFPLLAAKQLLAAKVIFWRSVNPNEAFEDIAGLKLETAFPDTAQPAQLVTSEDLWGHPFRVVGFPAGQPNGVSASGVLRGRSANGWVQLEDVKQPGYRLEPGFSGTPVWDEALQGVVGMAVAAEMNRADVKAAFIIPTNILVSAWSDLGERAIPSCPYRALFAFREEDAPFFFGRETFTERLVEAVRRNPLEEPQVFFGRERFTERLVEAVRRNPLAAVVGPSGSGKSSVVFAGLIPRLRHEGNWMIVNFRPGESPFSTLSAALIPLLEPQMSETDRLVEINKLAAALRQGDLELHNVVERIVQKNPAARHFLLVADQFEELYALCQDAEERQHILDELLQAVNIQSQHRTPDFTLVITLRADFLGHALSYRPFADALQDNDLKLGPMTRQELQDAIEKPAHQLGVQLEDGLTVRLLDAVSEAPGNLPLLEFALSLLWGRQSNGKLTHLAYDQIGGVEKALASYAEEVFNGFTYAQQQQAQRVFIQLVRPGEGTADTRRLATRIEVGEENWDLVTRLADARLVVTGQDEATGEETVEIVHEALIGGWQRLRQWMQADRALRTWQERLRAAIRQWETSNQDEGALLRGVPLAEAQGWLQERPADLSQVEQEYIRASLAQRDRENTARKRRQQFIIAGLTIGLLVTGWQWQVAESRRRQVEVFSIQTLNSLSLAHLSSNEQLEALVASVSAGSKLLETQAPSQLREDTVATLRRVMSEVQERNRLEGHHDSVTSVSFSPDGQMLASGSLDKTIKLWSRDGKELKTLSGHHNSVTSVSFSPDGQMLASGSLDKTIKLWSREGKELKTLQGHGDSVISVSFSPDGQMLASGSLDKTIKLWSRDGKELKTLLGHSGSVFSVSFNPKSQILASASADRTVKLWSRDGKELKTLSGYGDWVSSVNFSPDGNTLASASRDKTIKLWGLDGTLLKTFQGHPTTVTNVKFSPNGQLLASASADNAIKLWSFDSTNLYKTLTSHRKGVTKVSFSPNGQMLASGSWDNTIKLWSSDGQELKTLQGHSNVITSLSFSPNSQTLASASQDATIKLWNPNGQELKTFRGHGGAVNGVSFSPDGQMLASVSDDNTIKLWNLNGQELKTLRGHGGAVNGVSFSPDGQMLVSASQDKTIKLWSVRDGKELKTLQGHTAWVWDVNFSRDGQTLASTSRDKTIKLWSVQDGKELKTLQGHTAWVWETSFSPDGQTLASVSDDGTIKLWSLRDGQEFETLLGHRAGVWGVSFSPDGQTLASASLDGTVKLWRRNSSSLQTYDLNELLMRGCDWLSGYLKNNHNVREIERRACRNARTGS